MKKLKKNIYMKYEEKKIDLKWWLFINMRFVIAAVRVCVWLWVLPDTYYTIIIDMKKKNAYSVYYNILFACLSIFMMIFH